MEILLYLSLGDLIGVGRPARRHQLRHPVHRACGCAPLPAGGEPFSSGAQDVSSSSGARDGSSTIQPSSVWPVDPPLHRFHVILCKTLENKNVIFDRNIINNV